MSESAAALKVRTVHDNAHPVSKKVYIADNSVHDVEKEPRWLRLFSMWGTKEGACMQNPAQVCAERSAS